jgi:formamidopyrimidine-DNA glycosylase
VIIAAMPELPDVECYRRVLERHGLRREIAGVRVSERRILDGVTPKRLAEGLVGAAFAATRRHGKHLLARLDRGGWLALHFGMSGALAPFAADEDEPDYTRVRFDFEDGGHLAYISRRLLGRVGLADDADAFVRDHELGPDALALARDRGAFMARIAGTKRAVKPALMDQGLIAGIGNEYSDEILWQARIHPQARLDKLDDDALARLHRALRRVLETAVARGAGSEAFLDRLPKGWLLPRRVKDGTCPRCAKPLAIIRSGGRTAYLCPACQPKPK